MELSWNEELQATLYIRARLDDCISFAKKLDVTLDTKAMLVFLEQARSATNNAVWKRSLPKTDA